MRLLLVEILENFQRLSGWARARAKALARLSIKFFTACSFISIATAVYGAPVSNLSWTHVSSNTAALQWNNQTNNAYQAALSSVPGFAIQTTSGITGSNENTTAYWNLSANTSYTFLVKISTDDDSNYAVISTHTLAFCPGTTGFNVYWTSMTVGLLANNNPSTTTFRVAISSDGFQSVAFSSEGVSGINAAAPALTVFGLQPNTTYQIGIDAVNFNNLASSRTVITATSTLAMEPGAPAFSAAGITASSIAVSWSGNGNPLIPPTSYQLQISTDVGFGVYSTSDTFLTNAASMTLTGNTSYYFRVKAFGRSNDQIGLNASVSTFTLAAALQNVASTAQTVSSLSLGWQSANSPGTRIEISSSTDDFATQIATPVLFSSAFISTSTVFTNLRERTTYYFRLRAMNENNLISGFSTVLATRTASIIPEGISNLSFDGAFGTADGEIRWAWTAPGGDEQTAGVNSASYLVRYATFDVTTANFASPLVSTYTQTWVPASRGSVEGRTVTGLNPGTTYYFAIKGIDAVGNCGVWDTAAINANRAYFAKDVPLSAPTNPLTASIQTTSVTLSWTVPSAPTNVDDRDSYRVYYATWNFSNNSDPFVFQTTGCQHPAASVDVTGLANQTTYYFRLTAVDKSTEPFGFYSDALESAMSAATFTVTLDRIAPAGVSDLTALTGANEGEIVLEWTAPGDDGTTNNLIAGSQFQIKYSSVGIINSSNFDSPPSPSTTQNISTQSASGAKQSILLAGLTTAATYWFAVKTLDESGNIAVWNSSADVTTVNTRLSTAAQRDNVAPFNITGLTPTPGYRRMDLTWVSPGDNLTSGTFVGTFRVKYGTAAITSLAEFYGAASTVTFGATSIPGVAVSTQIVNLLTDATYYFAVDATDDFGNVSTFSAVNVKNDFPRNTAPGAFTISSPVDLFVTSSTPQAVSWNSSAEPEAAFGDAVAYALQFSTRQDFSSETLTTENNGAATSKDIAGALIENSTTYVRIRALDNDNYITYSDTIRLRVNVVNTAPSAPALATPANGGTLTTLTPTLDWSDSTDPDPGNGITYTLKYSTIAAADGGATVSGISISSYTIASALTENTTYYWKVAAVSTNPHTGSDTVEGNATYYFVTNSVDEAPDAFALGTPAADQRSFTTFPTFTWEASTDNDPGNTITYTLTVQNSINSVLFSTALANLTVTSYTLTAAVSDNNPYTWSVVAKSAPDNLTRIATPATGRVIKVDTVKQLPAAVTLSTPSNSSIVTSTIPTFSWTAATDPDNEVDYAGMDRVRYVVKIGERSDYSDALGQQTFFSDNNGFNTQRQFALKDQTTYFWQIAVAGYQPIGGGGTYVHVDTGSIAGCAQIIGGAINECYSVSAQFSFIVSLTNTPPSVPTLLSPPSGTTLATNLPTFDWTEAVETDPAQSLDYVLQISTDSNFSVSSLYATGVSSSAYTLTSPLLQNRTYYWRVLAQDHLSGGGNAGTAVPSAQTFSFQIPILTTPKEPTTVQGTLSGDGSSFTLSWNAVSQNTDGSSISDLDGYNVYRSGITSDLGTGAALIKVSSSAVSYVDGTVAGLIYYYTIRALNTSFVMGDSSGTISINSGAVESSNDKSVLVVPNDPELAGKIEIRIPESVSSVLDRTKNSYGEDLKFNLSKTEPTGLKNPLIGVRIKIKTAQSDQEISNFSFDQPIRITFPLNGFAAPRFGAGQSAPRTAASAGQDMTVVWNNGVEWVNLGAAPNLASNSVFTQTRNVGEFALKETVRATQFELTAVTPDKIFTPNGDGCNDLISFQYQNPRDSSNIKGKILDLSGAFIADLKAASTFTGMSYDSTCASPNLGADVLVWDGKNSDGALVRKGIYIYQIEVDGGTKNGTIIVAR